MGAEVSRWAGRKRPLTLRVCDSVRGGESMTDRVYPTIVRPAYIPLCLEHECRMIAVSTQQKVTYFKCPVSGCPNTGKAPRVEFVATYSAVNQPDRAE